MRIPDEVRKSVAFIGYKWTNGARFAGTLFFVAVPIPDTSLLATYAVTAKHVIDEIRRLGMDEKAYIRANQKGGDAIIVESECNWWFNHPSDNSVDVAVCGVTMPNELDHKYLRVDSFVTDEVISKAKVGVGDDLFLTGLFVNHFGASKNVPIVRVGNIAAMPEEPIATRSFGKIDAYLIEARSIGGLSGSPVFVLINTAPQMGMTQAEYQWQQIYLLGLMHGHFDLPESKEDLLVEDARGLGNINVGIGIVIPAKKILEVLDHPRLKAQREASTEKYKLSLAATPDLNGPPPNQR
jgi:hypothetical protein